MTMQSGPSTIKSIPRDQESQDPRWVALVARDAAFDESFWYSVRSTGVYCRPSCGARTPQLENVRFHASRAEAEAAGFRPCKRCKPEQSSLRAQQAVMVATACRRIEHAQAAPSLAELAQRAGISPWHFHRVFKSVTGVTPKAYATAHRGRRVRSELARGDSVTAAIYDAGYSSSGRFYAESTGMIGMRPSDFRAGGKHNAIYFALGECSLGTILVAATARGICSIVFGDDPQRLLHELEQQFPAAELIGADRDFEQLVARVVGLVEEPARGLDLPLDVRGTAFQHRVWQALREIPAGSTLSYAELADRIGAPKSARAVAAACAANRIAVAIPCHRVVRNDGAISGYRWGVERKRALLAREAGH